MPDEPKRRLTAGSDMYHNTAILDRILAIALEAGRKRDIHAVMLTARHGAELGPRYLYARISGSLIERTKPKYRHWVKSLIITKTPQMSDGYTKPISPLAMEDVALWRSQFPNLEHLYWDIDNPHARPYLNKIDINFRSEQSGRRATLRCQTRATVTVCRSRTLYSTFRRPLFKHFDVVSNTMTLTIRHSSGSGIGRSFRTFFAANETLPYAFTVDTLTLECDGSQSGDMVELISIMRHVLGDTRKIHMEGGAALNSIISILDASPSLMELHVEDCRADIGLHNLASVVRAVRTREVAIKRLTLPIIIPRTTAVGPEHPHLREADWSHGPVSDVKLLLYTSSRALRRLPLWIFRLARSLAGLLSPHATFEVLWSDAVIAGGGRVVLHSPLQYLFKAVTLWLQSLTPDMQTLVKQIHPASDHMPVIRGHNDLLLLQRRYGGTVLLPPMQLGTSARAGTRRSAARALTSPRSYSTGTA